MKKTKPLRREPNGDAQKTSNYEDFDQAVLGRLKRMRKAPDPLAYYN